MLYPVEQSYAQLCTHYQWRNVLGLAGVIIAVLVPVMVRYIWAKELSEAAEDVVEVVQGEDTEEREGNTPNVDVIVHHDSRGNGNSKAADAEWARLRDESAIQLPVEYPSEALQNSGLSSRDRHLKETSPKPGSWTSRLFRGKSEGKIQL